MRASLLFITFVFLTYPLFSQSKKGNLITVSFLDVELEVILDSLSDQTGFFFSYNSEVLPKGSKYTISSVDQPIDQFLSRLFVGTGLTYSFFKDQIILNYESPRTEIKKSKIFTIAGKVVNEAGNNLSDVNVFLDGTTLGTSTDKEGDFQLETIPPGSYDLVFSHIGYKTMVYQLSEYNGGARIQNHSMELDMELLDEVEIVTDRIESTETSWYAHYAVFKEELLGTSPNAKLCLIQNPESLNFSFNEESNTLIASSTEPIIIRNGALGYKITYYLESFEKSGKQLRFRGQLNFRNLQPLNKNDKRTWKRNRKSSYRGSFSHFKKSLIKNNLKEEGYRLYRLNNIGQVDVKKSNELKSLDIFVYKGGYYELNFKKNLIIQYKKEKESADFLADLNYSGILYSNLVTSSGQIKKNPGSQLSIIRLLDGPVRVDPNGQILDRFAITTYGYWSWERLADLVPLNYDPRWDNF